MTTNESLQKKLKKVIEEIILSNEVEFTDKFGVEDFADILKHKIQISKMAIEDEQLINIIKDEVEDIMGLYILKKSFKLK